MNCQRNTWESDTFRYSTIHFFATQFQPLKKRETVYAGPHRITYDDPNADQNPTETIEAIDAPVNNPKPDLLDYFRQMDPNEGNRTSATPEGECDVIPASFTLAIALALKS